MTLKITRSYRNCRYSIGYTSFLVGPIVNAQYISRGMGGRKILNSKSDL